MNPIKLQVCDLKTTLDELLKAFRSQYGLTQPDAWRWFTMKPGTYRDYEQGRSTPTEQIQYAIRNRIADYERDYCARRNEPFFEDDIPSKSNEEFKHGDKRRRGKGKRKSITVYLNSDIIKDLGANPATKLRTWIEANWKPQK